MHALATKFAQDPFQSPSGLRRHAWQSKNRSRRRANRLRIEWTDRSLAQHDSRTSKSLSRAQDRPQVPRILQPNDDEHRPDLKPFTNVVERKFFQAHQRCYSLRSLAGHSAIKNPVRQKQSLRVRSDLRKEPVRQVRRGFSEEHGSKLQPAADCFLHDPHALNRAESFLSTLRSAERPPKLFDQSVMAPFDPPEPLSSACRRC